MPLRVYGDAAVYYRSEDWWPPDVVPVEPIVRGADVPPPANTFDPNLLDWGMGMIPIIGDFLDVGEAMDAVAADPYRFFPYLPGNPNGPGGSPGYPGPGYQWPEFPFPGLPPGFIPPWFTPPGLPLDPNVPVYPVPPGIGPLVFDPRYWEHYTNCGRMPGSPPYGPGTRPYPSGGINMYTGAPTACATNQAPNNFVPASSTPTYSAPAYGPTSLTHRWIVDYRVASGVHRTRLDQGYRVRNPSMMRTPYHRNWFGNPTPQPLAFGNPRPLPPPPVPEPLPEWQYYTPPIPPPNAPPSPRNPPLPRPHRRQPPRPGDHEGKVISKVKALGIATFKALDQISEWSEVVDAFFDALPPDVKERWSRGRDDRPVLDQFSQFGIDGSDWKMQALYHNWHKVDLVEGIKNVIKNAIEDRLIGLYARHTGFRAQWQNSAQRLAMRDFDPPSPEMVIAGKLEQLYKALGLE